MAVIPDLNDVKKILDDLAKDFPDAYDEICKICDLLGLRHPPDPR
jgi:hypothetical protein